MSALQMLECTKHHVDLMAFHFFFMFFFFSEMITDQHVEAGVL